MGVGIPHKEDTVTDGSSDETAGCTLGDQAWFPAFTLWTSPSLQTLASGVNKVHKLAGKTNQNSLKKTNHVLRGLGR